ncbi:sigma-70 family RNA polymerase sigma factor [Leucobacter chinensis]|uniref:sigma-70 family RNA polymerase sigma factor n=1 Tax=Leucobacter chinensis TaxID=2851010 RepID=UPI001C211431|nr:sigma-70 family RNA polymerase sigma factor [Leucobacter chinensis]
MLERSREVITGAEINLESNVRACEGLDSRTELDTLTARAQAGDQDAVAKVVEFLISETRPMAFHLANGIMDPEDLQGEAIENLLHLWGRGKGPSYGAAGYLIRSMRNRCIDELRSPRSRTENFDADIEIIDFDARIDDIDLHREFAWVRRALQTLPADHQHVLKEIHAAGRKPADVAADLGRSADGVYSLHRRAKISLKRALLVEILTEDAPDHCLEALRELPIRVADTPEETKWEGVGHRHFETCQRCRKQWKRFGTIGSALGIGGLIAIGANLFEAAPAVAAAAPEDSTRVQEKTGPDSTLEEARPRTHRIVASSIAAGLAFGIPGGYLACQTNHVEGSVDSPGTIIVTLSQDERLHVEYQLDIVDDEWRQDDFVLDYPKGLQFIDASAEMDCTDIEQQVRCSDPGERPIVASLEFEGSALPTDQIILTVTASTDTQTFHGSASAAMPAPFHAVSTRADVR